MSIRRSAALGGVVTGSLLAGPAGALGAAFTAMKPCYVSLPGAAPNTEIVNLAGTGFTQGSKVDISVDGVPRVNGAPVDAAGTLGSDPGSPVQAPAPYIAAGDTAFEVIATEVGAATPAATASARVTALNVGLAPQLARPSSTVRFRGRGFTDGAKVYAHYRYRGRTRATVRFAAKGPCGIFTGRRRQIPVKRAGAGEWTVQFDQHRRYTRTPRSVYVRLRIIVTRTVRLDRRAANASSLTTAQRAP